MKLNRRTIFFLCLLLAVVFGVISRGGSIALPPWFGEALASARRLRDLYPLAFLLGFCLAHIFCSAFSVPASCTVLNVSSGAIFGFWPGCAIIYPVTLLSACLSYFAGTHLRRASLLVRHKNTLSTLSSRLASGGPLFLVSLRLSPVFPYGVLNILLGILHVPFSTFFASTFVGIFFDVFVLNGVGAALARAGGAPAVESWKLIIGFFLLLGLTFAAKRLAERLQRRKGP